MSSFTLKCSIFFVILLSNSLLNIYSLSSNNYKFNLSVGSNQDIINQEVSSMNSNLDYIANYCLLNDWNKYNCEHYHTKLKDNLALLPQEELYAHFDNSIIPDFDTLRTLINIAKSANEVVGSTINNTNGSLFLSKSTNFQKNKLIAIDHRTNHRIVETTQKCEQCKGGDWAIIAAEVATDIYFLKNNSNITPFSAQELLDCISKYKLPGNCDKGSFVYGLVYYLRNKNALLDQYFPFKDKITTCPSNAETSNSIRNPLYDIELYDSLSPNEFYEKLKSGPIGVNIDASSNDY
jgi:hypothetical protein